MHYDTAIVLLGLPRYVILSKSWQPCLMLRHWCMRWVLRRYLNALGDEEIGTVR